MKKLNLLFASLFFVFVLNELHAQSTWTPCNLINTQMIFDVQCLNDSTAWATGDGGLLCKTNNSGFSWIKQDLTDVISSDTLTSLSFSDSLHGCIVGSRGTILITKNGGSSWKKSWVDYYTFNSVKFITNDTGWTVGRYSRIYKTVNSGNDWKRQPITIKKNLLSAAFLNSKIGYISGEGGLILKTINGGTNWDVQVSNTTETLTSVFLITSDTVWVVGKNGVCLKTEDGGLSWIPQPTGISISFYSIKFEDSNNGWITGEDGTILKSTDGGLNWIVQQKLTTSLLRSINFFKYKKGWIVGDQGLILYSSNHGENWVKQNEGTPIDYLFSVCFSNALVGWAVGENGNYPNTAIILKTSNGGINWIKQDPGEAALLNDVFFYDEKIGWAVGRKGDNHGSGIIIKTIDGGATWSTQLVSNSYISSIHFLDQYNGWAAANNIEIWKTTDGGSKWDRQYGPDTNTVCTYNSIYFVNQNIGWAIPSSAGSVHKTIDGGLNWSQQDCPIQDVWDSFTSSFFISQDSGWITGRGYSSANIWRTADGGATWNVYMILASAFEEVQFINSLKGWAAGGGGVYSTIDGGVTWNQELADPIDGLTSIFILDSINGWAVGHYGIMYKRNLNLFTSTEEIISQNSDFTISPNPATNCIFIKINALLAQKIKVDIIGINGITFISLPYYTQTPIELDVSMLPKGIYLVKIQSNLGVESKKLVIQ